MLLKQHAVFLFFLIIAFKPFHEDWDHVKCRRILLQAFFFWVPLWGRPYYQCKFANLFCKPPKTVFKLPYFKKSLTSCSMFLTSCSNFKWAASNLQLNFTLKWSFFMFWTKPYSKNQTKIYKLLIIQHVNVATIVKESYTYWVGTRGVPKYLVHVVSLATSSHSFRFHFPTVFRKSCPFGCIGRIEFVQFEWNL